MLYSQSASLQELDDMLKEYDMKGIQWKSTMTRPNGPIMQSGTESM